MVAYMEADVQDTLFLEYVCGARLNLSSRGKVGGHPYNRALDHEPGTVSRLHCTRTGSEPVPNQASTLKKKLAKMGAAPDTLARHGSVLDMFT